MKRHLRCSAVVLGLLVVAVGCSENEPSAEPSNSVAPTSTASSPAVPSLPTVQPVPAGRTGVPAAGLVDPRKVDQANATSVASAAMTATYRMDTSIDNSPRDAAVRAQPFLTPEYAAALRKPIPGGGGAEWSTWVRHRAYTQVLGVADVTEAGAPPDTATQAARSLQVTYQAVGRDRWRSPKLTFTAFLTLVRSSTAGPWRVSAVEGD